MLNLKIYSSFTRNKPFLFLPNDPSGVTVGAVDRDFQPSYDIVRRSGAKGCLDHRIRARPQPAYTAQLLTLHQHRAHNQ